eukprot:6114159-Pleurochrysis_carterae.AAC.4
MAGEEGVLPAKFASVTIAPIKIAFLRMQAKQSMQPASADSQQARKASVKGTLPIPSLQITPRGVKSTKAKQAAVLQHADQIWPTRANRRGGSTCRVKFFNWRTQAICSGQRRQGRARQPFLRIEQERWRQRMVFVSQEPTCWVVARWPEALREGACLSVAFRRDAALSIDPEKSAPGWTERK